MATYNYRWQDCAIESLQIRQGAVGRTGFLTAREGAEAGELAAVTSMLQQRGFDAYNTVVDGKNVLAFSKLTRAKEDELIGLLNGQGVTSDAKMTENGGKANREPDPISKLGKTISYNFRENPANIVGFMGILGNVLMGYSAHLMKDIPRRSMAWGTNNLTAGVAFIYGNGTLRNGNPERFMRRLKQHLTDHGIDVPRGDTYDIKASKDSGNVLANAREWFLDNVSEKIRKASIPITQLSTIYGSSQELRSADAMQGNLGIFRKIKAWGYVVGAGVAIVGKEGHGEGHGTKANESTAKDQNGVSYLANAPAGTPGAVGTAVTAKTTEARKPGFFERAKNFVTNPMFFVGFVDSMANIIGLLDSANINKDLELRLVKPYTVREKNSKRVEELEGLLKGRKDAPETKPAYDALIKNYETAGKRLHTLDHELDGGFEIGKTKLIDGIETKLQDTRFTKMPLVEHPVNALLDALPADGAMFKFLTRNNQALIDKKAKRDQMNTERKALLEEMQGYINLAESTKVVEKNGKKKEVKAYNSGGTVGEVSALEAELSALKKEESDAVLEASYAQRGLQRRPLFDIPLFKKVPGLNKLNSSHYAFAAKITWLLSGSMWMFTKKGKVATDGSEINHSNDALTSAPVEMLLRMSETERQIALGETASYLTNDMKIGRNLKQTKDELIEKLSLAKDSPWLPKMVPANNNIPAPAVSTPQPVVEVGAQPATPSVPAVSPDDAMLEKIREQEAARLAHEREIQHQQRIQQVTPADRASEAAKTPLDHAAMRDNQVAAGVS